MVFSPSRRCSWAEGSWVRCSASEKLAGMVIEGSFVVVFEEGRVVQCLPLEMDELASQGFENVKNSR